ncbi:phosphoribosyltransferase [Fervidicella metallireducens AeB]|uniref:Phosphoribosyltransferase n=1 Tax=Fervidicella metallireducens AeB TaxID=1403537 RepID=A0A017RVF1_9CLOT|nr:phosphoribosyltransferase family protein [Fervidicella metallireducens]EYE88652.1 phosphoribosyltransferase [Fervidicella metallireducens AeB]
MFKDRNDAADKLYEIIKNNEFQNIVGIPKGGMVIAKIIADKMHIPYTGILTKKIGAPWNKEIAIGAVSITGEYYLNEKIIERYNINKSYLKSEIESKIEYLIKQNEKFNYNIPSNKSVLIVDDGIATGYTVWAAVKTLKTKGNEVYIATPVISQEAHDLLKNQCKEIFYNIIDSDLIAIGFYYKDFSDVTEEEIIDLFKQHQDYREV